MKNEPAFPGMEVLNTEHGDHVNVGFQGGMTLRDYFAAKAMHAFLVDPKFDGCAKTAAKAAYYVADIILETRNET